jgi:(S)-ureidoglycine aminohydrolase
MNLFGNTRTVVRARHALIAPDGHVPSALPGWTAATATVLLSPAMGAGLTQLLARIDADGGAAAFPADGQQHALYVTGGSGMLLASDLAKPLRAADFAYIPAGTAFSVTGAAGLGFCVFRMPFQPLAGAGAPGIITGCADDVPGLPFLGNPKAILQTLLPDDLAFDFAMNLFTYQPGATLPFVETHVMEHGLLMLDGQGIYRLEDSHYPVTAGDAIWMAPYCPQWFVAMGDAPARYLYCKNVNRLP